jgi:predicted ArsR family transcriptional regulator
VKTATVPVVPRSRTHHQVLASASRSAVLQALRDAAAPCAVADVAIQIGLHQNTVRGHLDVLVDAGYAVRRTEPPRGPGRPRIVYEATSAPDQDSNYKLIAEVLAEYVAMTAEQPAEAAASAGRSWARGARTAADDVDGDQAGSGTVTGDPQAVMQGLVRLLADGGFQPEVAAGGEEIHLRHCPFGDLAVTHPDVVCGAHLGIIQASLAELGGPVSRARLLPLVQPGVCVAHLHGDAPSDDGAGAKPAARPA